MKFTQEDKEIIYNRYMDFINKLSDDLDTFSEISPKELVYSVLALVEDMSSKCSSCKVGTMKEMSIYDDMDGMLTCDKCGARVKN